MTKFSALFSALWALLKGPFTIIGAYLAGWGRGLREREIAQKRADLEALKRGIAAGDAVRHDAGSVRNDPRKPSGIAKQFPSFGGTPVTVIKGNLVMRDESLGREVYVLVPDHLVSGFQAGEPAKALPAPNFDRDEGWQEI